MNHVIVPEGMLQAANEALSVEQNTFHRWLKGEKVDSEPGANGYPLLLMLRASLLWLSENMIEPSDEELIRMREIWDDMAGMELGDKWKENYIKFVCNKWQKIMFNPANQRKVLPEEAE